MEILVIGKTGQVARAIQTAGLSGTPFTVKCVGRPEIDLLRTGQLAGFIADQKADFVINAAAYTAVDAAEDELDMAEIINAEAPRMLALGAKHHNIPFIHISTDYVFDGQLDRPFREDDLPRPISAYGTSKMLGEIGVREAYDRHLIVRTAWIYSPYGRNFVKTILASAHKKRSIRVVGDQVGNPTSAGDLADGLLKICASLMGNPDQAAFGTYHMTGTGEASWFDVANSVFKEAINHDYPGIEVIEIPTHEYPTRAARPLNSRLDCTKLRQRFGIELPLWQITLKKVVADILQDETWRDQVGLSH